MQQYRSNSYLFGGNAPYVEELYEAYLDNPGSVPDNWRDLLRQAAERAVGRWHVSRDVAHAPVVESFAQRAKANAFALKASASRAGGGAQAGARAVADRGLPLAGRALGRPRPAQAHRTPEDSRARAGVLRPDRSPTWTSRSAPPTPTSPRPSSRRCARSCRRCAKPTAARSARSSCTSPSRPKSAGGRSAWSRSAASPASPTSEKIAHPRPAHRGRGPGALPAHQVRRPEALLARRRRELHRQHGRAGAARRRQGRAGDRHRHGAPRAPERAGQHAGQDAQGPVRRVRPHRAGSTCRPATSSTTRASRATSPRRAARCT